MISVYRKAKTEILIAHPGKHHVLHLAAGCINAGLGVTYVTPFYRLGLGRLVAALPGKIGNKAKGYFHPSIPVQSIVCPALWQLRKLWAIYRNNTSYEKAFDIYVAKAIETGQLSGKVLITLQDYMPLSVRAARNRCFVIWSDQILNQSAEMVTRISHHERAIGMPSSSHHDERQNDEIISASDVITAPSSYCFDGIKHRVPLSARAAIIPYGASAERFDMGHIEDAGYVVVLARAPSIRKGGHLLLKSLQDCGDTLLKLCSPKKIEVIILGALDPALKEMLEEMNLPIGLTITSGSVAHSDVPQIYQRASLFVMPSLSEGMSLACMEAMHARLPLIVTKYCGIDGFVSGEMGYQANDTTESLTSALVAAFNNRHLWSKWGESARHLALGLTWSSYEAKIGMLAREVIA